MGYAGAAFAAIMCTIALVACFIDFQHEEISKGHLG